MSVTLDDGTTRHTLKCAELYRAMPDQAVARGRPVVLEASPQPAELVPVVWVELVDVDVGREHGDPVPVCPVEEGARQ